MTMMTVEKIFLCILMRTKVVVKIIKHTEHPFIRTLIVKSESCYTCSKESYYSNESYMYYMQILILITKVIMIKIVIII
jgi:type IV secretory pathway VirB3-like protein